MNYRHLYHAGNFADVFKHAVLTLLLEHLKKKDTPFAVIDTHAGIGRYDLASVQAEKTGEWREGIGKILEAGDLPPTLAAYAAAVRAVNAPGQFRFYPGSPRISRHLLRPQDRLALVELHPEDVQTLRAEFKGDRQVGVHHRDAYESLKGLLPPPERRGLVLIDPPFEVRDEFERIAKGLEGALKRWPTGLFAVWYPIKGRAGIDEFYTRLQKLDCKSLLVSEFLLHLTDVPDRLNGCGMAILNPPWQLDAALAELAPDLLRRLGGPAEGARLNWVIGPA